MQRPPGRFFGQKQSAGGSLSDVGLTVLRRRPRDETISDASCLDRGDDGSVETILADAPACDTSMAKRKHECVSAKTNKRKL